MMRASRADSAIAIKTTVSLKLDHDRWHGHVRRLPCLDRRQDRIRLLRRPEFDGHQVDFPSWPTD